MIESIKLGVLRDIEPRNAWQYEDRNFTPWLAENLDRLGDAIGIPLELTQKEMPCGRYCADILAVNPEDDRIVLIENQLEWSDHRHLGQILTYLAGLDAEIIVWLAPNFTDEHISAIGWLNQNTDDRFAFFAVKLRVVQIGDSEMAPLFDVVEKPNSWERTLTKTKNAIADEREKGWRRVFWDRYLERVPHASEDRGGGGQGASRWRNVPDSELIVARWVGEDSVSVFIRGDRGVRTPDVYEDLEEHEDKLASLLGVEIGDNEWYPFEHDAEFDISDPDEADRAIDWLENETVRFIAALKQVGA